MLNLLSNAIKYTPQNGFITVDITRDESNIRVSVKDSGMGIPKNKIDNIFDRFSQVDEFFNRKYEGSGIGLALVKDIINKHNFVICIQINAQYILHLFLLPQDLIHIDLLKTTLVVQDPLIHKKIQYNLAKS